MLAAVPTASIFPLLIRTTPLVIGSPAIVQTVSPLIAIWPNAVNEREVKRTEKAQSAQCKEVFHHSFP